MLRLASIAAWSGMLALLANAAYAQPQVQDRFADVSGIKIHYLTAGEGSPILLLHGFAQTSHMWRPAIAKLATKHRVIAPDLHGFGDSAKPAAGYDKKTLARDIHGLVRALGIPIRAAWRHTCRCWS